MRICCVFLALALAFSTGGCSREHKVRRALARAKVYADAAEREKAKISYLTVLRLDPNQAEAAKQIGLLWSEQGAPLQAARFLTKAKELAPQDLTVRAKLALALATLQQNVAARQEAETVLQRDPQQPDALQILARTLGSPAEASALADRLHRLDGTRGGVRLAGALLALYGRDLPAAETAAQAALAVEPESAAARSLLGTIFLARKDLPRAEQAFRAASRLDLRSDGSLAYVQAVRERDRAQAKNELARLCTTAPDYLPFWILQARFAAADRQPAEALAALEHVFQIDNANYEARLLQGQQLQARGEVDKSIAVLDKLNGNPVYAKSAAPKFELARAYLRKGNPAQAAALLTGAVKLQPHLAEAVLLLAQLKLQGGDARSAVEALAALRKDQPDYLPGTLLLAQAHRASGNLEEAARVLSDQLKATPDAAEPRVLLGSIQLQQNRGGEARATLEAAARLAPENLGAATALVNLDLTEKNPDGALHRAEALVREFPAGPEAFLALAKVQLARGQAGPAEQALKKCIALDADFAPACDLLVSAYLKTNQLDAASGQLDAFLARHPADPRALTSAGIIQEKRQNWDKARAAYEKLLAVDPNSVVALNNLAVLDRDQFHQLEKADELANRAHSLRPDDPSVLDTLGWTSYQRKAYPQALPLLREAAAKLTGNPEVQYHYGMASYMVGETEAARTALTQAAAAPADFPGKKDLPGALAMLDGNGGAGAKALTDQELVDALQRQPGDLVVRQKLADRFERAGGFARAAALWEELPGAKSPLALVRLARLYAGPLHDPAKAFDYARKARVLAPEDREVTLLAGRAAYGNGNFSLAYSLLQEPARLPDAGADVLRDFAWTAYDLGKVAEARQAMQRALDAAPDAPEARGSKRFLEFTALEDRPAVLPGKEGEIQAALGENAQDVPALMLGAALDVQRKQGSVAASVYRAILARLPDFGLAQKRLAALSLEDPAQGSAAYELAVKARRNLPDDPEAAQILAVARYRRGEFASVVPLLQESAGRRPLSAGLWFCLGMSRLWQKQAPSGYQALEQALAAGLAGPEADEARRALSARKGS